MSVCTRISFYHGLGNGSRNARDVPRTRAFIRDAAAHLRAGNSFFGFEFAPGWTFQARRAPRRYYVELLDTRTLDVTRAYCRLPTLLCLIDLAWHATDAASLLRAAPRLAWRQKNVRTENNRNREPSCEAGDARSPASVAPVTLGHGDHWEAIFPNLPARMAELIPWLCVKGRRRAAFAPLQPDTDFEEILRLGYDVPAAELAVLLGRQSEDRHTFLSAYPIMRESRAWTVRIEKTSLDYGPFEGVVDLKLSYGAGLRCFDPCFGENASRWTCGRDATVSLAGLALRLELFDPAPIRITEGPLLDQEREQLRKEGKAGEAETLDHLDVQTDSLRTLYCTDTDHAHLVGRVERVRETPACELIDIEAIPDEGQPPAERVLPVYAFAPALGAYRPQPGDLVHGTVWLQAAPNSLP